MYVLAMEPIKIIATRYWSGRDGQSFYNADVHLEFRTLGTYKLKNYDDGYFVVDGHPDFDSEDKIVVSLSKITNLIEKGALLRVFKIGEDKWKI